MLMFPGIVPTISPELPLQSLMRGATGLPNWGHISSKLRPHSSSEPSHPSPLERRPTRPQPTVGVCVSGHMVPVRPLALSERVP